MPDEPETKAAMKAKERNALSDSDFAYIDSDGNRHLPINDADHVRAALARFDQTSFESDAAKATARKKIMAACAKFGIDVSSSDNAKSAELPEEVEYKTLGFEMEAAGDELAPNEFKGYVAITGNVDDVGDVILPGAFKNVLPDFLANGALYFNHGLPKPAGLAMPIGKPLEAYEDSKGLFLHGRISDTAEGRDVLTLMRDGVLNKLSVGYIPKKPKLLSHTEGKSLLGESQYADALKSLPANRTRIRALTDFKRFFDGSLVTIPANSRATVLGVKSGVHDTLRFDDHFAAVQDATAELAARFRELHELRAAEGRVFSESKRAQLETMRDAATATLADLDSLMAETEAKAAEPETYDEAARAELAKLLRFEASLLGVA